MDSRIKVGNKCYLKAQGNKTRNNSRYKII